LREECGLGEREGTIFLFRSCDDECETRAITVRKTPTITLNEAPNVSQTKQAHNQPTPHTHLHTTHLLFLPRTPRVKGPYLAIHSISESFECLCACCVCGRDEAGIELECVFEMRAVGVTLWRMSQKQISGGVAEQWRFVRRKLL
jgi:hypothetical protein